MPYFEYQHVVSVMFPTMWSHVRWCHGHILRDSFLAPLFQEPFQLLLVSSENVLFTAGKIGVYLAGQERILGDVGVSGVLVQGEEQEPDNAHDDTKEGENIREANVKNVGSIP